LPVSPGPPCSILSASSSPPAADSSDGENDRKSNKTEGDPLRAATGIRPSLHPLTINAVADVLKKRAQKLPELPLRAGSAAPSGDGEDDGETTGGAGVRPIDVALSASQIAADAIAQRQRSCEEGDRGTMMLSPDEEQTFAGRIVGVTMRLQDLETLLDERCAGAGWVSKYGEWDAFGVLPPTATKDGESDGDEQDDGVLDERILSDPLFTMNRAECLLALFLGEVEEPELLQKGRTVPDNSVVDFLDADRKGVVLPPPETSD